MRRRCSAPLPRARGRPGPQEPACVLPPPVAERIVKRVAPAGAGNVPSGVSTETAGNLAAQSQPDCAFALLGCKAVRAPTTAPAVRTVNAGAAWCQDGTATPA